jgi:hypothetical protein
METKYCSYSVLAPKGKRKSARRSCKKTSNPADNSDLCEVLNKRCGLKENHERRLTVRTNSKRVSPKKKKKGVKSVQPKPAPRKVAQRQAVVEELPVAPRKTVEKQAVVEELPVAPRKTVEKQAVVEELPVAPKKVQQKTEQKPVVVEELLSSQSKDKDDYDNVVKKLHEVGEDVVEYSYDNEFGPPSRDEDWTQYRNKRQLFEEIQKHYGSKMIDIKKSEFNSSRGTQGANRTTISVNPNFKKEFAKLN